MTTNLLETIDNLLETIDNLLETIDNLLETIDILTEAMQDGFPTDIIYIDFAKAFNTVAHRRLLLKLSAYGIRGELLAWIASWLSNRQQRVVIGEHASDWAEVTSGVPQGLVLGQQDLGSHQE